MVTTQNTSHSPLLRKTQEGCAGLRRENPGAFPKARPIFQQPFALPENAQILAGIAFCAAGEWVKNFPAVSKLPENFSSRTATAFSSFLSYYRAESSNSPNACHELSGDSRCFPKSIAVELGESLHSKWEERHNANGRCTAKQTEGLASSVARGGRNGGLPNRNCLE